MFEQCEGSKESYCVSQPFPILAKIRWQISGLPFCNQLWESFRQEAIQESVT